MDIKMRKNYYKNKNSNDQKTKLFRKFPAKRKPAIISILTVLLFVTARLIYKSNTSIEVNHYTIEDQLIPKAFDDTVIVHISDLHNKEFGTNQKELLETIKNIGPDMIAVTGDLIDTKNTDIDIVRSMDFINGAVDIAPTYFVTGNHDLKSLQYPELEKKLIDAGVIVLRDQVREIKNKDYSLYIVGLDDPVSNNGGQNPSFEEKLSRLSNETDGYTILLSHRPEKFDIYVDQVNLVLSGHTHGGQIRFPFIGALVAPDQGFFPKYSDGLYEEGNSKMIISRGLGTSVIPIRFNNSPEIIVVTLRAEK